MAKSIVSLKDTKGKEASTFEDARFWDCVAQIKIDGHNPADILKAWPKERNPKHFEDSEDRAE
jgi:hypothetical protein